MNLLIGAVAMKTSLIFACLLIGISTSLKADTYKCIVAGKTVISDYPCVSGAAGVDQATDKVSRSQQRHAEIVHQNNRVQVSQLEQKTAAEKNSRSGVYILRNEPELPPSKRSSR